MLSQLSLLTHLFACEYHVLFILIHYVSNSPRSTVPALGISFIHHLNYTQQHRFLGIGLHSCPQPSKFILYTLLPEQFSLLKIFN